MFVSCRRRAARPASGRASPRTARSRARACATNSGFERREVNHAGRAGQQREPISAGAVSGSNSPSNDEAEHGLDLLPQVQRVEQRLGVAGGKKSGGAGALDGRARVRRQDVGPVGRVAELQVLRDELDVDQAAAPVLDVPSGRRRVARAPCARACRRRRPPASSASRRRVRASRMTFGTRSRSAAAGRRSRARASAPCAPRSRPTRGDRRERLEARRDRPLVAGRAQPHVDVVEPALAGRAR